MRLVLAGLLLCLSLIPVVAHPGHDYWQDEWVVKTVSPTPSSIGSGLGIVALAGLMLIGWVVLIKSIKMEYACLILLVGIVALSLIGCQPTSAEILLDDHMQPKHDAEAMAKLFEAFKADGVSVRSDGDFLFVESNSFPSHPMMVGIKAWQQQVPLPQPYTGRNAWRIPLKPVVAAKPISAKTQLFRGAIAIAVNGVPIFNALNNRGDDALKAGELDEHGGHCGRGDDYHYHIAPVHLEKTVGQGKPIAYALDGFPIYGYTDDDGKVPTDLDEFNGRYEKDGRYRYYATKTYPYINGGMRGQVTVRGDQIDPQPRDSPVRPAQQPLRDAKITTFARDDDKKTYTLKYDLKGQTYTVRYALQDGGKIDFTYIDPMGTERTESFRRRDR